MIIGSKTKLILHISQKSQFKIFFNLKTIFFCRNEFNYDAFDLSEDNYEKRQEIFNKICDEKIKEISDPCTKQIDEDKSDWLSKKKHHNSSSSDEEDLDDMCLEEEPTDRKSRSLEYPKYEYYVNLLLIRKFFNNCSIFFKRGIP